MSSSPHELIDMPLAIMIVASTADADPIATFQALMRTQALPQHYHIKVYDEKVPKLYLLLHDNKETSIPEARVLEIYETMKRTFGHSLCHWQTLNSSSEDEMPSPWGPEKGLKISQAERFQLQVFVNEILTRVVIPYVEFKLKELDGIFEQKRRVLLADSFGRIKIELNLSSFSLMKWNMLPDSLLILPSCLEIMNWLFITIRKLIPSSKVLKHISMQLQQWRCKLYPAL
jgi:hypothetical protein